MFRKKSPQFSETELHNMWRQQFSAAQVRLSLKSCDVTDTVDDIILMTLGYGKTLEDLLCYLDSALLPGIYRETVEFFMKQHVRSLISDEEVTEALINSLANFGTTKNYILRDTFIAQKVAETDSKNRQMVESAMHAYVHYGLKDYRNALIDSKKIALKTQGMDSQRIDRQLAIMLLQKSAQQLTA